ncbi:hypothetical protein BDP27DRAFT_1313068 [Rhodocollybia butyracea]|uniref:Uncharacterized protein n=1 Tax=Rhodocollybia butyracea TaxID=206335 RepID=A0A9P5QAY2_9AGAR|nr:hypothetical protein BDP27DRAFT_1313068 [Rhodocollybia butyracea]
MATFSKRTRRNVILPSPLAPRNVIFPSPFAPEPRPLPSSLAPELIAQFLADHDKQDQCPLFDRIPAEVRNIIFIYALLSYEDLSVRFPDDAHYSRPEYRHASRIDPRLLQACRLIYLETRFLPVMADEHVFCRYASNPAQYFARLSEEQKDHVDRVHFFTQQYYLEGEFPRICALPNMRPRSLKVTLRHGDWWNWESNNPLRLKDGWTVGLKNSKRLQEVILELETMERDKEQPPIRSTPLPIVYTKKSTLSATVGCSAPQVTLSSNANGWVRAG